MFFKIYPKKEHWEILQTDAILGGGERRSHHCWFLSAIHTYKMINMVCIDNRGIPSTRKLSKIWNAVSGGTQPAKRLGNHSPANWVKSPWRGASDKKQNAQTFNKRQSHHAFSFRYTVAGVGINSVEAFSTGRIPGEMICCCHPYNRSPNWILFEKNAFSVAIEEEKRCRNYVDTIQSQEEQQYMTNFIHKQTNSVQ